MAISYGAKSVKSNTSGTSNPSQPSQSSQSVGQINNDLGGYTLAGNGTVVPKSSVIVSPGDYTLAGNGTVVPKSSVNVSPGDYTLAGNGTVVPKSSDNVKTGDYTLAGNGTVVPKKESNNVSSFGYTSAAAAVADIGNDVTDNNTVSDHPRIRNQQASSQSNANSPYSARDGRSIGRANLTAQATTQSNANSPYSARAARSIGRANVSSRTVSQSNANSSVDYRKTSNGTLARNVSTVSGQTKQPETKLVTKDVSSPNSGRNVNYNQTTSVTSASKYGLKAESDGRVYEVAYDSNNNIIDKKAIDEFKWDADKTQQANDGKMYYKYQNPFTGKEVIGGVKSESINTTISKNYNSPSSNGSMAYGSTINSQPQDQVLTPVQNEEYMPVPGTNYVTQNALIYANPNDSTPIGEIQANGQPLYYDDQYNGDQGNQYPVGQDNSYYGDQVNQYPRGQGNPYYDGQGNQYPVGQGKPYYEGYGAPMEQPTDSPNGDMESIYVPGVGTLVKEKGEKYYHCNGMLYENPYDNPVGVDKGYYRESSYRDAEGYPANDSGYPSGYWQDVNRNFAPTNYSNNVFTNIDYARRNADIINGMMGAAPRSSINNTGLNSNIGYFNRSVKK